MALSSPTESRGCSVISSRPGTAAATGIVIAKGSLTNNSFKPVKTGVGWWWRGSIHKMYIDEINTNRAKLASAQAQFEEIILQIMFF